MSLRAKFLEMQLYPCSYMAPPLRKRISNRPSLLDEDIGVGGDEDDASIPCRATPAGGSTLYKTGISHFAALPTWTLQLKITTIRVPLMALPMFPSLCNGQWYLCDEVFRYDLQHEMGGELVVLSSSAVVAHQLQDDDKVEVLRRHSQKQAINGFRFARGPCARIAAVPLSSSPRYGTRSGFIVISETGSALAGITDLPVNGMV